MTSLFHNHLMTMSLDVDFSMITRIGTTPAGTRGIASVTGGRFDGERVMGHVVGGSDWFLVRPDGIMVIDVRMTLKTDDGVSIYLAYHGRLSASPAHMARFNIGEILARDDYSLTVSATFECGHPRYQWLNDLVCVGTGEQTANGPIYTFFEVGHA